MITYTVMSYGGIRSPDSEVVFRTTESLVLRGSFAVSQELTWKGFGLTEGKNGKLYSLFGPLEAVAAVPFYAIALSINATGWYEKRPASVPVSHYTGDGLIEFVSGEIPHDLGPHALRAVVCLFNIVIGSLSVILFFLLVKALTQSEVSALLTTILYAFGTLVFPYTGTFFSEPLAAFFVMLSLYVLVRSDLNDAVLRNRYYSLLLSGIFCGLATATHITAILFVPFFCLYGMFSCHDKKQTIIKRAVVPGGIFMTGVGLIIALLGYYNYYRFGNILETGRAHSHMAYGVFVAPWRGLYGLLLSSGKGLLLYCPAVALSLILWKPFHRRYRLLSIMILGAALTRIFFIASRSDWHGGFCLGPRYMVMIIPLLILPLGVLVDMLLKERNKKYILAFAVFTLLCISEQIYFSVGEIFSFLHIVKWNGARFGIDVFENDFLYLNWDVSPLIYLLDEHRGSFMLNKVPLDNYTLWLCLVSLTVVALFIVYYRLLRKYRFD